MKYKNYGMIGCYACCISFFSQCLCCSMPAPGSTPVAFLLCLKNCSAEVILGSMVQCSVVCCIAADMSKSSLLAILSPLFSSWFSGLVAEGNAAAPEFLSSLLSWLLSSHLLSLTVLRSYYNISFHLCLLICPLLISLLPLPTSPPSLSHPLPLILMTPFFSYLLPFPSGLGCYCLLLSTYPSGLLQYFWTLHSELTASTATVGETCIIKTSVSRSLWCALVLPSVSG